MGAVIDVLAEAPLLTLFLAIALGTLVGAIPIGPLRFGPAGALFVGLAIGALDPRLAEGWGLVQSIGLALFVYTIGLAAGTSFFRDLRRQTPLMLGAVALLVVYTFLAIAAGRIAGLGSAMTSGVFSGALTATPALAAATAASGSTEPAVGYAITYPIGVLMGMLMVTFVVRSELPARKDPAPVSAAGLLAITVQVVVAV